MKQIKFNEKAFELLEQLMKGAFLTVKDKDGNLNTMTIAWGSLGYMWRKPIFITMVRYSRHTYKLIENSDNFTVSFPLNGQLKEMLAFCGTKSGRDVDKFESGEITPLNSTIVETPVIKECDLHLECKIVYKQPVDPQYFSEDITAIYGEEKDYHVLYYGEIVSCWLK